MSLIHNERTKLTANALDRASTACLTVGVLGPFVAFIYGLAGGATQVRGAIVVAGAAFWVIGAVILHFLARRHLGRLT